MANKNYIWISDKHKIYIFSKVPNIQWDSTVWDILILNMFCCLFEIQMWLGILYFIWQLYFFFKPLFIYFLRAVLDSQQNWKEGTDISHIPFTFPAPPTHTHKHAHRHAHTKPPSLLIFPTDGTFVTTDGLTLTHHTQKSIVYFKIHTWYCTLCGFEQTYNDMHPSIWYLTECCHCPKNSSVLLSVHPSRTPLTPAITDPFTVSLVFPFLECYFVGII